LRRRLGLKGRPPSLIEFLVDLDCLVIEVEVDQEADEDRDSLMARSLVRDWELLEDLDSSENFQRDA